MKKAGALVLSLLAAGGIWHKAHEPAMNDEQMDKETEIAAEAVLDKIGEFEGDDPRYADKNGSYSSYRSEKGDHASAFAYNIDTEHEDLITDETEYPGTYVTIAFENDSIRGKHDKEGILSETEFTFKSGKPQDYNDLVADGQLTIDEVNEFINRDDVDISELTSLEDSNGNDALTNETLDYNALTGGDDNYRLEIDEYDGVSGVDRGKDGLSGEDAVAQVQRVVDMVKIDNWGESK